jgi:hypothetical protein
MGNIIPYKVKSRETERFILNGAEIPGVQSVLLEYTKNVAPLNYLGISTIKNVPLGKQVGSVSIDSLIIGNDYFINYTGASGFNGYLLEKRPLQGFRQEVRKFYDMSIHGFISGYLTNYSQSCALGEIPRTQMTIDVFKDIGLLETDTHQEALKDWNDKILTQNINTIIYSAPNAYNLDLSLNEIVTNRVISYNFSINIDRTPVYVKGSRYPIYVITNQLKTVNFNCEIEIDAWTMDYLTKYPEKSNVQTIALTLKDFETNNVICSYSFENMELLSLSRNATVNDFTIASLSFKANYL